MYVLLWYPKCFLASREFPASFSRRRGGEIAFLLPPLINVPYDDDLSLFPPLSEPSTLECPLPSSLSQAAFKDEEAATNDEEKTLTYDIRRKKRRRRRAAVSSSTQPRVADILLLFSAHPPPFSPFLGSQVRG